MFRHSDQYQYDPEVGAASGGFEALNAAFGASDGAAPAAAPAPDHAETPAPAGDEGGESAPQPPPDELDLDGFTLGGTPASAPPPPEGQGAPAPSAPAPAAAPPPVGQLQQANQHLVGQAQGLAQQYQQLLDQDNAERQFLQQATARGMDAAQIQGLVATYQQNLSDRAQAVAHIERQAGQLAVAKEALDVRLREAQFRERYEPAAQKLWIHELVAYTQQADPSIDAKEMQTYLQKYGTEDVNKAAKDFYVMHRKAQVNARQQSGIDDMGAPTASGPQDSRDIRKVPDARTLFNRAFTAKTARR